MNNHPLYAKLSTKFETLPDDADYALVGGILLKPLKKIIAPFNVGNDAYESQQKIKKLAEKVDHLNLKWGLADRLESIMCVDLSRHNPAVDKTFFPFIKGSWYWTRDAFAVVSSGAWSVNFSGGYSSASYRYYGGYGLAVAPLPPGQ